MIFVCWLWKGHGFDRQVVKYGERHVTTLSDMLWRHGGHSLWCVHDGNFSPPVPGIRMPDDVAALPDYLPKLWAWSAEFHALMPGRFASIDLDAIVVADLEPVLASRRPLKIWDQARGERYNTSLFALQPGFGNAVWDCATPEAIERAKAQAERWTGDQSFVSYILGDGHDTFGESDGVLQYRPTVHRAACPDGARALFTCGPYDPKREAEESEWIREAYR